MRIVPKMCRLVLVSLMTTPAIAHASGCMGGVFAMFFLLPGLPCVSALAIAICLRGHWEKRLVLALVSVPAVVFAYFAISIGIVRVFIKDYPACSMWPDVIGAAVALGIPALVIGLGNRSPDR
jgi:membrane associated rhomboid family serine protease